MKVTLKVTIEAPRADALMSHDPFRAELARMISFDMQDVETLAYHTAAPANYSVEVVRLEEN